MQGLGFSKQVVSRLISTLKGTLIGADPPSGFQGSWDCNNIDSWMWD